MAPKADQENHVRKPPVLALLNSTLTAVAFVAVLLLHAFASPLALASAVLAAVGIKADPGRRGWHIALLVISALILALSAVLAALFWSAGPDGTESISNPV